MGRQPGLWGHDVDKEGNACRFEHYVNDVVILNLFYWEKYKPKIVFDIHIISTHALAFRYFTSSDQAPIKIKLEAPGVCVCIYTHLQV